MIPDPATLREIKKIKLIGLIMWVAAPTVLLQIGFFSNPSHQSGGHIDMMWYMLLIIALVSPLMIPLIERHQITNFRTVPPSRATPAQFVVVIYITRFAIIEVGYLYGLVTYFLSGDPMRAMLFAPIGILWSAIYWPRYKKILRTLERMEAP